MDAQLFNLKRRVDRYKEVLQNTENYREMWKTELRAGVVKHLKSLLEVTGLDAEVEEHDELKNLESIVLTLGSTRSGLFQIINEQINRDLIKHNGSLVYQQLFNGKILVLINYPFIENYGQPRPPKTIAIYRPEELKEPFFIRHLEEFVNEITHWEDYDDDQQAANAPIGFNFGAKQEGEKV
jgi:hypothetical protein